MSRARCFVALFAFVLSASLAQADGLLYQLPKDGSWATYDLNMSVKMPGGQLANAKGTVRLASVGQVTENGEPCRWIELQYDMTMTMGEHKNEESVVQKLLIPEKYLVKGETPLDHVLRAWVQHQGGEVKKLDKPTDIDAGPLPLILSGPWKEVKALDKAEVESKLGKVACEGVQGNLEFTAKRGGVMKCKIENRLHADSPFGVVTSRWSIQVPELPEGSGMDWNLKLTDFGADATSKMPDAK